MFAAALGSFLAAIEDGGQHFLKPFWPKQSLLDVAGNQVVQLLHRDRAAFAPGLALPRLDGAGVIAIPPAFAGPERHRAATAGTEADAGKEGGAADDTRRRYFRVSGPQVRLHGIKGGLVDQWRHLGRHDFAGRLPPVLGTAPVELVTADIGRPRQ